MSKEVYLTLAKGARVLVMGKLKQRSYETRDGDKRTVYEVEVDEIGPSLRFARAQVTRTGRRTDNGSGNGFGADNPTRATPTPEPATASPTPDASDPRATSVPVSGGSEVWAEPALAGVGAGVFGQSPY